MSDCVFWSFEDSLEHLGIKVEPFAYELFRALRKPSLPDNREIWSWGWKDDKTNLIHKVDDDFDVGNFHYGRHLRRWDFSYTHGAVAPLIIHTLAAYHGLAVRGEYDMFYPPEMLRKTATTEVQANVASVNLEVFGKEVAKITLEPAIYLMIDGPIAKHAMFSDRIPVGQGMIAGAYQIYRP